MRIVILALVTGCLLSIHSGCSSAEALEHAAPASLETMWDREQLESHLRILNSTEVEGRGTGTHGYARATEYVAAQMAAYQLQPAIGSEHRLTYAASLNYIQAAQLALVGRDTLRLGPGIDFLADARSDSGMVRVRRMRRLQGIMPEDLPGQLAADEAVLISAGQQSDALLIRLREAGVRLVFIEGELAPEQAQRRIPGIVIVRVTPATVEYIEAELERPTFRRLAGGAEWHLIARVISRYQPAAGVINVLGFLGGKHPVLSEELIIVCADLDAMGWVSGVRTVDFEHFGTDVAAMLEVARMQAEASRVLGVPDRTVLFAAWAGGRLGHAGFRSYLNRPVWPLEATRAVIYLGLDPEDEAILREQLVRYGIILHAVPMPGTLVDPGIRLIPSPTQKRMAISRHSDAEVKVEADMSEAFERASLLAGKMVEEVRDLLVQLTVAGSSINPVFDDGTSVPKAGVGE